MKASIVEELIRITDWNSISRYRYLSEDFIKEFKDKVDWNTIFDAPQNLTDSFIKEFIHRFK